MDEETYGVGVGDKVTGETLNRRYHELCGWRFENYHNGGGFWHQRGDCKRVRLSPVCECGGGRVIPPLHLDANLAIAEACKMWPQTRDGWLLESHQGETRLMAHEEPVTVHGEGPLAICEVILKALIAAKESQ